ncbi:MAG TPA: Ig-like domain-containing protein [Rhodanobacteraceae bacterium]|nr:Ig-like domain-containing protein [Rhodanobacteraceae bacterium]
MRRFIVAPLVAALTVASAAPPWPDQNDGTPSVTNPSVPFSYVGNDASVSLGLNEDGHSEGQLMGVFARNNERAAVGQLWWDQSGAGGLQGDFNWLWGMDALYARAHPDEVTVARLSFALDQNGDHDRKATVGFGIERRAFSVEAYLASGISGARRSDSSLANALQTINGTDDIGAYTQVITTTTESVFDRKPYGTEIGFQASHFFEATSTRLHGGFGYQDGSGGARANTVSLGVDTPLGTRGWALSGLAEHVQKSGSLDQDQSDDRIAVYLRYEFGAHGSFVPTDQLEDPAWISRSLARPSSAHPRNVESYRQRRTENVTTTRSPKNYTNHFPIAQNDSASVTDGSSVTLPVLQNDSDPDGDALAISAVTQPAHGLATIAGTSIVYTPGVNFTGTDAFRYTIGDGKGGVASANVTITVSGAPNRPPQAVPDNASTTFGQRVTINVLANDTDPDGNALTITGVTQPAGGSVAINGTTLVFTPAPGFSGTARFTYTIDDGHGGTSSAAVTVFVAAQPNRPPVAANDAATTPFATPVTIAVLANDSDPDGNPLSISTVTAPAHGTATISGTSIVYTPAAGYSGPDTFNYTISDGRGGSATASVAVTVTPQPNRPPVAVNDTATTLVGQPVVIAVLANDSDPDGDPLTIVGVTTPANGTVSATATNVTYTPALRFTGTDTFTYTIDDGRGGTATATVTVTVGAAPNRPPVAVNDTATTTIATPVTINVIANDSDPDGDPLTVQSVTTPTVGTAAIVNNEVVYTPTPTGAGGTATFDYTINDGRGGTATATVTVTVGPPPNRPPVAVNDAATTTSGQPVTINVIANDSDPDGDPLTVQSLTAPRLGSATIINNEVVYTPAAGVLGTDTFTYTINDGRGGTATATVTVTITAPVNRPPVAVDDNATTAISTPVVIDVLANDSDPDGDPLTIISVTQPANGVATITNGEITYQPQRGFTGTVTFQYTISDGRGGTATATVTVVIA